MVVGLGTLLERDQSYVDLDNTDEDRDLVGGSESNKSKIDAGMLHWLHNKKDMPNIS